MRLEDGDVLKQQRYLKQNLIPLLSKEYHPDSQIKKQFKPPGPLNTYLPL